jgi:hypothetical protein
MWSEVECIFVVEYCSNSVEYNNLPLYTLLKQILCHTAKELSPSLAKHVLLEEYCLLWWDAAWPGSKPSEQRHARKTCFCLGSFTRLYLNCVSHVRFALLATCVLKFDAVRCPEILWNSTGLHSFMSQKMVVLMVTALRTWSPALLT